VAEYTDNDSTRLDYRSLLHPNCIVCGLSNPCGLQVGFDTLAGGEVTATFHVSEHLEGYSGVLHGGMIASIIDGAMVHCMFARDIAAVTVEMNLKYRHPVLTGRDARVTARIIRSSHTLHTLTAEIVQDAEVKVIAEARFFEQQDLQDLVHASTSSMESR